MYVCIVYFFLWMANTQSSFLSFLGGNTQLKSRLRINFFLKTDIHWIEVNYRIGTSGSKNSLGLHN